MSEPKMPKDPLKIACKASGGLFMAAGGVKLFKISDDLHKELKRAFKDYASVFPLAPLGIVPDHKMYKHVVGGAEIAFGAMVVFGKNKNKRKGCVGLMVIMAGATQAKLCLGEYVSALVPATALCGFGALYFMLKMQDQQQKKEEAEEAEAKKE